MPVTDADIVYYKSANGSSEGGAASATEVVDATEENLFPHITDSERLAGGTRYRKFFATNEHATDSMIAPVAWLAAVPVGISEHIAVGFNDGDDDEAVISGNMTAWSGNAVLAAVSDGSDTRNLTIVGVTAAGAPIQTSLVLTGTTETVTATSFSKVYAVMADSKSGTRTVTIRQGAGGTTRGTIATNRASSFLWLNPTSKATGITLPDLVAGASYGFWDRQVWAAAISGLNDAESIFAFEEA